MRVLRQLVVRERHSWHQLAQALCQMRLLSHMAVRVKKRDKGFFTIYSYFHACAKCYALYFN